jgi:hypothetical protein
MTVIVQDTFTEASDTALASHTPDIDTVGTGWTAFSNSGTATFTVVAASDTLDISEVNSGAVIDTGLTGAMKTSVDFNADSADNRASVQVKNSGDATWATQDGYQFNFRPGADALFLTEVLNNSGTTLDTDTYAMDLNVTYNFAVTYNGGNLSVDVDGDTGLLTAADSTYDANTFAMVLHNLHNGGGIFDNFVVDDLAGGAATILPRLMMMGVG